MSSTRATFCSKQQCREFRVTPESSRHVFLGAMYYSHVFAVDTEIPHNHSREKASTHQGNYVEGGGRERERGGGGEKRKMR